MARSLLGSANLVLGWIGHSLLKRRVKRSAVSLLGSANLIHSWLRRNGSSNIASRHRQEAIAVTARCTPRKSQGRHYPPTWKIEQASLEGSLKRTLRLAIAYGDRSNRTMHPSQVARGDRPPLLWRTTSKLGRSIIARRAPRFSGHDCETQGPLMLT
jgi:hypothetical protein